MNNLLLQRKIELNDLELTAKRGSVSRTSAKENLLTFSPILSDSRDNSVKQLADFRPNAGHCQIATAPHTKRHRRSKSFRAGCEVEATKDKASTKDFLANSPKVIPKPQCMLIPVCVRRQRGDDSMSSSKNEATLNASQCNENPGSNNLYDELIHLNAKEDSLLSGSEKLSEVLVGRKLCEAKEVRLGEAVVEHKKQEIITENTSNLPERKEVDRILQIYTTEDTSTNFRSATNQVIHSNNPEPALNDYITNTPKKYKNDTYNIMENTLSTIVKNTPANADYKNICISPCNNGLKQKNPIKIEEGCCDMEAKKSVVGDSAKQAKFMKTIFIDIKYSPSNAQNVQVDIKDADSKLMNSFGRKGRNAAHSKESHKRSIVNSAKKIKTPLTKY